MEKSDTTHKSYLTIVQGFGLTVAVILIAAIVTSTNTLLDSHLNKELSFSITYTLSMGISLFLVGWATRNRNGSRPIVSFEKVRPQIVLAIVTITFLMQIGITAPIINLIPIPVAYRKIFVELSKMNGVLTLATTVIVAPVVEELIFRRFILDGFLKRYSPLVAILVSSLLFALFHLNPWQFASAFLIGLLSGWVYFLSRNILLSIVIHIANNLLGFSMGYFFGPDYIINNDLSVYYGGSLSLNLIVIVSVFLMIPLVYYVKANLYRNNL